MMPEDALVTWRERLSRYRAAYGSSVRAWIALHPWRFRTLLATGVLALIACAYLAFLLSPPRPFPTRAFIEIPDGLSARGFGQSLAEQGVVRSPLAFEALARLSMTDTQLQSGRYVFDTPISTPSVLGRIASGQTGIAPIRVTLTEGMTVLAMADTFEAQLPGFDRERFLDAASTSEGYLFPETYFYMPGTAEQDIVTRLRAQFSAAIEEITPQILESDRSFSDVVVMASLLEREAQTLEEKRIIAGILWKRLDIGMPLQVDAVFGYIRGEDGYAPTFDDLEIDSPYNTYLYEGLPPTPIANPGLESLTAALTPTKTDYLFYLTGLDGNMYYAVDFDAHRENRRLYLD